MATFKRLAVIMFVMFFLLANSAAFADSPRIRVDGEFVEIAADDQQPIIIDGRTLVPLRAVMEALGFRVEWYSDEQQAVLSRPGLVIGITIGAGEMQRMGAMIPLEVPAQIINDRTMVPVRAISEATGFYVNWDNDNRIVEILTGGAAGEVPPQNDGNNGIFTTAPQSNITLPNRRLTDTERNEWIAEYHANGGASEFELEVVRLINEVRAENGLHYVEIDERLMMAARFYSQIMVDLDLPLGHNAGPYATDPNAQHGASANIAEVFGANLQWGGGNGTTTFGGATPQSHIDRWMNSDGHRRYILSPEHRFIGAGFFGHRGYLFLSSHQSN